MPRGTADLGRAVLEALLLGLGYFALAWVSVQVTPYAGGVAYVWPAGGVALATLLLAPRWHWPYILLAVFAANAINALADGHSLEVAVLFAVPNVLCAGGSAWLLLRLSGRPATLASVRGVLVFTLVAAVGVNALAALLGAAVPHFFYGRDLLTEWWVWWVSDALGVLLVAPLILAWSTARPGDWASVPRLRVLEAAAIGLGTAITAQIAFGAMPGPSGAVVPLSHLITPFLVWAALRFHIRGAASAVAVAALVALWNTASGNGPFAAALAPGAESVLHLQEYLAVVTATALLVGALVHERAALDAQLREAQKLEALGTMAGGIAHDFNNILGAILGFGEMAAERAGDNPRLRQSIAAILDAGRRGKALVDQILAASRRTPRGRRELTPATVLREVHDLLAASAPPGVTLRLRVQDEHARIMGDATRLHQLVMNLATNGIDAMQQGGSLELWLRTQSHRCAQPALPRPADARPLRRHRRARYRQRHPAAGAEADLRTLLYDQRTGSRHRPGPGAGLRDHQRDERRDRARDARGKRHDGRGLCAGPGTGCRGRDRCPGGRSAWIVAHRPGGGRRSSDAVAGRGDTRRAGLRAGGL